MFDAGNAYEFPQSSFNNPVTPPTTEPSDTPLWSVCFNQDWLTVVLGALDQLIQASTWIGDVDTVRLAQSRAMDLKDIFAFPTCPADMVQTPFWDEASDVDLDETADMQTWYGSVDSELTFTENVLVWAFTGLIALATPEIGFAPAILFHTIAPKFLIAQKAGDIASIIHIVLDGQEQAKIDTTGLSGQVIEQPIYGDPTLDAHDLLLWSELA